MDFNVKKFMGDAGAFISRAKQVNYCIDDCMVTNREPETAFSVFVKTLINDDEFDVLLH
jgi:hypothetical protein